MRVEINEHIIIDSEICSGKPIFKGTRIMVWQVLELLGNGITIEDITRNYFPQLDREAILSVLNYASKLVEDENFIIKQRF